MRGYSKGKRLVIKEGLPPPERKQFHTSGLQKRKYHTRKVRDVLTFRNGITGFTWRKFRLITHMRINTAKSLEFSAKTFVKARIPKETPSSPRAVLGRLKDHPRWISKDGMKVETEIIHIIASVSEKDSSAKNRGSFPRGPSRGFETGVKNIINAETISALKDEIMYLWEIYKIDPHYRDAFFACISGMSPTLHVQHLAKEIENLYKEKSTVQKLCVCIRKREEIMAHVEKMNEYFMQNPSSNRNIEVLENVTMFIRLIGQSSFGRPAVRNTPSS